MKLLEDILKEKCEKEDTEILLAQWKYDKELYKDILQNTKDYYCHYTDHGINHSEAVLSNIVRILGIDKIKELSSLDIWLLLEAAYIHDSGMFITREEVEELCKSKEFCDYFECLKLDMSNDLYEYTSYFEISNNKLIMLENEYNLKAEYGLKFIIGEYNRSKHSKRAKGIINKFDRFKKENTLIPKRIIDIAFLIAESHGKKFEDVMKIDKIETGLKLEKGHPRFIACLLRIGDLLDIDNNRFSKIVLKNIEDIMPQKSKNHLEKHKSIVHYRVDNDLIEITAKVENCGDQTYDVVSEVSDWFEYLKGEHNLQILNWGKIKPVNFSGVLPTLGEIKINVKDYDFIDNMNKPKFTVDTNNVLAILKGSGIYRNKLKALREIIQNSIDAIFLKVYSEKKNQIIQDIELNKNYNELKKEYLKNEEIQITIKFQKEGIVEISIKDTGIGINKDELKFLISAGSSPNNYEKKILIKKMPFWLRPSGNFGIGFQSIFMLTDQINIKSKKSSLEKGMEVDLFSPSFKGNKKGKVFIKKWDADNLKYSTRLNFLYKYKSLKNPSFLEEKIIERKIPANLLFEIKRIAEYSPIKINLKVKDKDIILEKNYLNEEIYDATYIKRFGLEILKVDIKSNNDFYLRNGSQTQFFYKNQKLNSSMNFNFFNLKINFLEDEAHEILEINREKLKDDIELSEEFEKKIIHSMFEWIKIKIEDIKNDEKLKLYVSMFINYYDKLYNEYLKIYNEKSINEEILEYFKNTNDFKKLKNKEEINIKLGHVDELRLEFEEGTENIQDGENNNNLNERQMELYFYLRYLLRKYYYQVHLERNFIKLKKVEKKDEEEIKVVENRDITNYPTIDFDYTTIKTKNLKIDLNLIESDVEQEPRIRNARFRNRFHNSLLFDIERRNLCFYPLKNYNGRYLFDEKRREKYIEICLKYNANPKINKEEIEKDLEKYLDELSQKQKIYEFIYEIEKELEKIKEKEKIKNKTTEKINRVLEIFPEIKLENGGIDFDKLKQLIENKN